MTADTGARVAENDRGNKTLSRPPRLARGRSPPALLLSLLPFLFRLHLLRLLGRQLLQPTSTEPHSDEARRGTQQIIAMVVDEAVVDVVTHEVRPSGPTTLAQPQITIDDLP